MLRQLHEDVRKERGLSASTIARYWVFLKQFIVKRFSENPICLQELFPEDISGFLLRHARSGIPGTANLMISTHRPFSPFSRTETIKKAIADRSYVAEFDDDGSLLGIWMVSRLKKMKVFRGIGCCVEKKAGRKGIGRSLSDRMKAMWDAEKRLLTFDCKAANPAIAFLRKMGFKETGTRRRGKQKELYRRFAYIPKKASR